MVELTAAAFTGFFDEVTRSRSDTPGHEPFLWQLDLVTRLLQGELPDLIDVPTGLGKTSVIHAWTYALAAGGGRPTCLARRLFFVVDRRLVVDGTFEEATALSRRLLDPPGPATAEVAARLRALHGDERLPPLGVVRMRGGTSWEARWVTRPDQAAIVVGTVDQFGSRLLFRGYGTSPRMRSIDAALTGTDAWLVIDEAHIATPLVRTIDSVRQLQRAQSRLAADGAQIPALAATRMSATAPDAGHVLRADLEREASEEAAPRARRQARARLDATKPVSLVDLTNLRSASRKTWRRSADRLGRALAGLARLTGTDARVVGIVANTIAAARAAHRALTAAGEEALLLIGRCRPFERDIILERPAFARARAGAPRYADEQRLYVVATQTIEVGANLDFDLLVSEAAPLASLIQRFGRVNRLGRWAPHRSLVVHAGFAHGEDDPIYGRATAATWRHLLDSAAGAPVESTWKLTGFELPPDAHLDLGLRPASALADAASPDTRLAEPFVPTLLAAHVERWSRTSPTPWPDQDVGPFLHGVQYEAPTVSVAWRAMPPGLLSTVTNRDHGDVDPVAAAWRAWLDVVRPTTWEFVDIPIWELRGLLSGTPTLDPTSDLEVTGRVGEMASDLHQGDDVLGVVYGGPEEKPRLVLGPDDVRVGDRVILDARVGGHDAWGWTGERNDPDDRPVPDIADLNPARRRPTLRLSPTVLRSLVHPDRVEELERMVGQLQDAEDQETTRAALVEVLPELLDLPERAVERLRRVDRPDLMATGLAEHVRGEPFPIMVLAVPELEGHEDIDVDQISDDDALSSSTTVRSQSLDAHGAEVGLLAGELAVHLGLPDWLCGALATAGRWHDLGKADRRFQVMLFDGDGLAADAAEDPRAKSGRSPADPIARRAFSWSGLPTGFRHEAVSARLVDELLAASPELTEDLDTELIRHLVASHHGHGRPLLPPLRDPDAPPVRVTVDGIEIKVDGTDQGDWGQPSRFEALNARYGQWGLALLEAIVRMADMRCSEVGG